MERVLDDEAFDLVRRRNDESLQEVEEQIERFKALSTDHQIALLRAEAEWVLLGKAEVKLLGRREKLRLFLETRTASMLDHPARLTAYIVVLLTVTLVAVVETELHPPEQIQVASSASLREHATSPLIRNYSTPYGKKSQFLLEDGSTLFLNWNSDVTVSFTNETRSVSLNKGEVIFTVAKNADRPFIVSADGVQARAVGTQFNVRRTADGEIDVAVTEGVVEISVNKAVDAQQGSVQLRPSQSLAIRQQVFQNVQASSLAEISAWRYGMLVFENRPLAEVLADFDRYTSYAIRTEGLANVDQKITGTFFIAQIDDALSSVVQMLNLVTTTDENAGATTITVRPSASH